MVPPKPVPVSPVVAKTPPRPPALFQAIRQETSESIWLVQSDDDPCHYYLFAAQGELIQCLCSQAQRDGACPHVTAVRLTIKAQQSEPLSPSSHSPAKSTLYPHPAPRNERERQLVEDADRRDRALLWTDDRPFSTWKE